VTGLEIEPKPRAILVASLTTAIQKEKLMLEKIIHIRRKIQRQKRIMLSLLEIGSAQRIKDARLEMKPKPAERETILAL